MSSFLEANQYNKGNGRVYQLGSMIQLACWFAAFGSTACWFSAFKINSGSVPLLSWYAYSYSHLPSNCRALSDVCIVLPPGDGHEQPTVTPFLKRFLINQ